MKFCYYKINESNRALIRAYDDGFGDLIKAISPFGKINRITTKQDDVTRNYKEINIKLA